MISSLLNESQKFGWQIVLQKNRANWTGCDTTTAIDTLVRVNKKLIITLVNAIAWTDLHAGRIFGSDTRLGNHREVIHDLEYGHANRACP
jgi:hypothetical protein